MDIWFTSDNHWGHKNIIQYENRPFNNTIEMDQVLIDNWNKVVKPNDIVWNLGDVFLCSQERKENIMSQLNGKINLIKGNHDKSTNTSFLKLGFQNVYYNYTFDKFIVSHRPIYNTIVPNVHGHVHSKIDGLNQNKYKCVCVELTNYTPIHIDEIIKWIEGLKS